MIFVQIAAYRDPQTLPTILDCIDKAKYKADLRFGICWQKDESDTSLSRFESNSQFRIEKVRWDDSQGLGWARSRIQNFYRGEEYTLQIDSHHRFIPGWDDALLRMVELAQSPKPIIGSYAGVYDTQKTEQTPSAPFKIVGEHFTPTGTISFHPREIEGWEDLYKPVRARFVSGHYFFTLGKHCEEYRYDPLLYFAGDEISLSVRSFTLGYDLFHPHRTLIWHEYIRQGLPKHWTDHAGEALKPGSPHWHEREAVSKRRIRKLLREEENDEDLTGFDLGTARSHFDYERYAGIHFRSRRLHPTTVAGAEPPCVEATDLEWVKVVPRDYRIQTSWSSEAVRQCDDLQFLYFGIEDSAGNVLFRYDAGPDTPEAQSARNEREFKFVAASDPAKLVVWPFSRSRGWLRRADYTLGGTSK